MAEDPVEAHPTQPSFKEYAQKKGLDVSKIEQSLNRQGLQKKPQAPPTAETGKLEPLHDVKRFEKSIRNFERTMPLEANTKLLNEALGARGQLENEAAEVETRAADRIRRKAEERRLADEERIRKQNFGVPEEAKRYVPQSQIPRNVRAQAEQNPIPPAPAQREVPQPLKESIKRFWDKLRGKA